MGFFSRAFLVFLMRESKKRRQKQLGKLMAKSRSQPVSFPGAQPLMNPLQSSICFGVGGIFFRNNPFIHVFIFCINVHRFG